MTMLALAEIQGCHIHALDGELGRVDDLLFDDENWTIRYVVVNTGRWLLGRRVLISPHSIHDVDPGSGELRVNLTMEQVEHSPSLSLHEPVTRRFETEFLGYYGWPYYWLAPYVNEHGAISDPPPPDLTPGYPEDVHLQSVRDVRGYHIHAADDHIGHVEDFLVDETTWDIRSLVVDTRNWLPGREVLVAQGWISDVRWAERAVTVDLTRSQIEHGPPFNPGRMATS
jgi:sporulation protein YlmC with PRC-barrel domain